MGCVRTADEVCYEARAFLCLRRAVREWEGEEGARLRETENASYDRTEH